MPLQTVAERSENFGQAAEFEALGIPFRQCTCGALILIGVGLIVRGSFLVPNEPRDYCK